jgi:SAM-dependent methyltransferase
MISALRRHIQHSAATNDRVKALVQSFAGVVRYDLRRWTRVVYERECTRLLQDIKIDTLDVLEISAGETWQKMRCRSYRAANYPEFDICTGTLDQTFDLIIADQVFEHLLWPNRGARNVLAMLRPGGYFLVITPFLVRVHEVPNDCSRWTETGLRYFLADNGFDLDAIQTGSWGNLACVKATLVAWSRIGWFASLRNDPAYPVVVWALARKSAA